MKYKIIGANDAHNLSEKINEMIRTGWKPMGGVALGVTDTHQGFYQAVIKEEN